MGFIQNVGGNPLDKLVNAIGAAKDTKDKVKGKVESVKPATVKAKAVRAAKGKLGLDTCKHRGVKRGKVCNCGTKIL